MDLRQHCRNYDILAKTIYGFKRVVYSRNLKTYAMDPETSTLFSLVPEVLPQIPMNYRIEFVRSGVAHESGHLINKKTLIKVTKILKREDHEIFKTRKIHFLKQIYNILVDISHERCQAEKYPIDGSSFHIFWSHIEDNMWSLEKVKVEENKDMEKEIEDVNSLLRHISLTERNIKPKRNEFPEVFLEDINNINSKVLDVVRKTYDSEKIFYAAVELYDIIMKNCPNFESGINGKSGEKQKVKIIKVKGCPEGMELGDDFDIDNIDPEDIEIEEMDFEEYVEKILGHDYEEFNKKCVKNKNSDLTEEEKKKNESDASSKSFNEERTENQSEMKDPIHFGDKDKVVVLDYDVVQYEKEKYVEEYNVSKKSITDFHKLEILLRKKLISKSNDKLLRNQVKGRLDDKKLYSIPLIKGMKIKPIFRNRIISKDYKKTKITLLIDESGSMYTHQKYVHARSAAILFSEILDRLKIDFEIIGFSTNSYAGNNEFPSCATRTDPLYHVIYKKFKEKLIKERLGGIKSRANNCDGESLIFAAMRLMMQNASRRILFVFSDGYPNCYATYNMQNDLVESVKICEKNNIEVYGIGVCSDAVKQFYSNWIIIDDATKLSYDFYKKLDSVLSNY